MNEQLVRDLAVLVGRLIRRVEKIAPNDAVAAKARDFLKRNNLLWHFSVTRDDKQPESAE